MILALGITSLAYIIGVIIFGILEYKYNDDNQISYFVILSWIGVIVMLVVMIVDYINTKLK